MWTDYFNRTVTPQTDKLHSLLVSEPLALGDLILTEVLQGFAGVHEFNEARKLLTCLTVAELGGKGAAIQAARNFRTRRNLGLTVGKAVDSIMAARCIESGYDLLQSDKDFSPFVKHLGLRSVA
jgi:predicted nucleic acid-binding protein